MRSFKLALAALAAAALVPATAAAAPAVNGVFDLPATPHQLALGPDGNVWITLDGLTNNIARVRPDGTVDSFTSAAIVSPIGIVAGPDGQLWVTESNAVAHFSPSDPATARRVDIVGLTANRIVVGPDSTLWTGSTDAVVRIRTDETFTSFRPTGLQSAKGIAAGGDGNLYVADFLGRQVVGVTTAGVATDAYAVDDSPQEVAAGPAGQLAVTIPSDLIERFTPPSRTVQRTDVPLTDPTGIVFAPADGAYWAANFPRDTLTRMTPDGAVTTLAGFPRASGPRHLTAGRDGTLWVGLEVTRQVARVTGVEAPPTGGDGGGGATGGDRERPRIDHAVFPLLRAGRSGTLKLTLSEAATVTIRFERRLPGRRKAGRCVVPRRAAHGRRCTRLRPAGTQTRRAVRGANRLAIGGKVGRRTLPVGSYRIMVRATDAAGNVSRPVTVTTDVNPRRRPGERVGATL
jgi:virginiamycin B lyase